MPVIASTSGRLHSEFVRLLFLQADDRFFAASGVQLAQANRGQFHYRRAAQRSPHSEKEKNPCPRELMFPGSFAKARGRDEG
jgi:hypothetical protein